MSTIALTANNFFDFTEDETDNAAIFSKQELQSHPMDMPTTNAIETRETVFDSNVDVVKSRAAVADTEIKQVERNQQLASIYSKLSAIAAIGDEWNDEGIKGPNSYAIETSKDLATQFVENELLPIIVTQTVEEGISFVFKNSSKTLYLEIYNDEEMGIITEDYESRKILSNKQVKSQPELLRELNLFFYR